MYQTGWVLVKEDGRILWSAGCSRIGWSWWKRSCWVWFVRESEPGTFWSSTPGALLGNTQIRPNFVVLHQSLHLRITFYSCWIDIKYIFHIFFFQTLLAVICWTLAMVFLSVHPFRWKTFIPFVSGFRGDGRSPPDVNRFFFLQTWSCTALRSTAFPRPQK